MFRWTSTLLLGVALSAGANAAVVTETFESEGLGTRYTAAGVGVTPFCCQIWNRRSTGGLSSSTVFSGFEGVDFWAGEDLNDGSLPSGFSASNPRDIILNASAGPILSFTVALAGTSTWESSDFLRLFTLDASDVKTVIDVFVGGSGGPSGSGGSLSTVFSDFTYHVGGTGAVRVGFEAWNTSNGEVLGIDNVRVYSNVDAPASLALLAAGIVALGLRGRRQARRS